MGKEEPKRGRKASGVDLTANEIRDIAYRVTKIASRLHGIADDMDGVGIPVLRPTPGYRADLDALKYYVTHDADDVADGLWAEWGAASGINGGNG